MYRKEADITQHIKYPVLCYCTYMYRKVPDFTQYIKYPVLCYSTYMYRKVPDFTQHIKYPVLCYCCTYIYRKVYTVTEPSSLLLYCLLDTDNNNTIVERSKQDQTHFNDLLRLNMSSCLYEHV